MPTFVRVLYAPFRHLRILRGTFIALVVLPPVFAFLDAVRAPFVFVLVALVVFVVVFVLVLMFPLRLLTKVKHTAERFFTEKNVLKIYFTRNLKFVSIVILRFTPRSYYYNLNVMVFVYLSVFGLMIFMLWFKSVIAQFWLFFFCLFMECRMVILMPCFK